MGHPDVPGSRVARPFAKGHLGLALRVHDHREIVTVGKVKTGLAQIGKSGDEARDLRGGPKVLASILAGAIKNVPCRATSIHPTQSHIAAVARRQGWKGMFHPLRRVRNLTAV